MGEFRACDYVPCALHVAHIVLTKVSKFFTQIMAQ